MTPLQHDFLPKDLLPLMQGAGIDGCVAVQARQSVEETDWLLALAAQHDFVRGVVGWVPLASPQAARLIARYRHNPHVVGFRHGVQSEPQGFLADPAFNRGVDLLCTAGLVYELLITQKQLPETTAFADRHQYQILILDHLAKPEVRGGSFADWRKRLAELARRPHVHCKLSGLATEADWNAWTPEQLTPYLDAALEAFGPARLLAGSDWPVCTLATGYSQWWSLLERWAAPLSRDEQDAIFGGNATFAYRLQNAGVR